MCFSRRIEFACIIKPVESATSLSQTDKIIAIELLCDRRRCVSISVIARLFVSMIFVACIRKELSFCPL